MRWFWGEYMRTRGTCVPFLFSFLGDVDGYVMENVGTHNSFGRWVVWSADVVDDVFETDDELIFRYHSPGKNSNYIIRRVSTHPRLHHQIGFFSTRHTLLRRSFDENPKRTENDVLLGIWTNKLSAHQTERTFPTFLLPFIEFTCRWLISLWCIIVVVGMVKFLRINFGTKWFQLAVEIDTNRRNENSLNLIYSLLHQKVVVRS